MDFWTQVKSIEEEMLGNSAVRWISGFNFHGHLRSSPPSYSPCSPCPPRGPALPHQRGCGPPHPHPRCTALLRPAPPRCRRPAPVPTPCSPCPCPAAGAACSLLALCAPPVRTKGHRRRLRFLARFFHLARAARSARHRLKTTAPYNAKPAVESIREHERSPSSHDARGFALSPQLL